MTFKKIFFSITLCLAFISTAYADQGSADDNLKYFVIQGKAKPEILKMIIENPADPMPAARKMVASIEGARLIDYYFVVGSAQNLAIIAVPDSKYAAAITYQRMATGFMEDMQVYEVIPANRVAEMLQIAKDMNEHDTHLKNYEAHLKK